MVETIFLIILVIFGMWGFFVGIVAIILLLWNKVMDYIYNRKQD